jgi:hypothetical protein
MILDRAPEPIKAFPIRMTDDGYGGLQPTYLDENGEPLTPVEFDSFALPVGFSGAGWAINSKLVSQGWSDVNRVRLIYKPTPVLLSTVEKWSRLEFWNQAWTAQEVPRHVRGVRASQQYVSLTVELLGDL